MDFHYLYEFVRLSELQNYQQAAESLFISQSSLSKHIQSIEAEVGVSLIDRSSRKVQLTPDGIKFLAFCRQAADLYSTFLNEVHRPNRCITINAFNGLAEYNLIRYLSGFTLKHPDITFDILPNSPLPGSPRPNGTDFFFFRAEDTSPLSPDYKHLLLVSDPVIVLLRKDHPLAGSETLTCSDLAGCSQINSGSTPSRMAAEMLQNAGISLNSVIKSNREDSLFEMVSAFNAIGFSTRTIFEYRNISSLTYSLLYPLRKINLYVQYREDQLSPAAKAFLDYLKDNI